MKGCWRMVVYAVSGSKETGYKIDDKFKTPTVIPLRENSTVRDIAKALQYTGLVSGRRRPTATFESAGIIHATGLGGLPLFELRKETCKRKPYTQSGKPRGGRSRRHENFGV